jgi:fused signal recognition particle receptor
MKRGLWHRIKTVALTDVAVLVKGLPRETLDAVEKVLVEADLGVAGLDLAGELEEGMRRGRFKTNDAVREWLVGRVVEMAAHDQAGNDLRLGDGTGPGVIVLVGVNGVGKTTQAAKLAHRLMAHGATVLLAAADTYRAGASEQLQVWAERLGVPCVTGTRGADPASVAFDALEAARARKRDVVIVDTAGRLHTERDLMSELQKIIRVIGRQRPGAPHESLLVLDGTVGQNALAQGKSFANAVPVTGLIVTKMDGTARGGAVIELQRQLGVPIRFVGVGEGLDDLESFDAREFAERLVGD